MKNIIDSLYVAWAIAQKDIVDALKNKNTRTNILLVIGMVVFFYWVGTVRSFDKKIDVIIFDEGSADLFSAATELSDGYSFKFKEAATLEEMKRGMGFKELAVVVPVDFLQTLEASGEPILTGYILWVHRNKVDELETKYTEKFTELLGQSVRVEIGENFVIPPPDVQMTDVNTHILFATLFMALLLVPPLMLEEKQSKTMDVLLVSPASAGQIVLGKAMTGLFYMLLSGGLFLALNWVYVTNWGLALLAFLLFAGFSIGLALVVGSFVESPQQMSFWTLPIIFIFVVPAFFSQEPNLAAGLKAVISWIPTSALVEVFQFAISSSTPMNQFIIDMAVSLVSTALIFAIVVWKVRRSDR